MKKLIMFLVLLGWVSLAWSGLGPAGRFEPALSNTVWAADQPDLKWFKETMKIAPQYQGRREGILGMSWAHVIFMGFLIAFFIGVLVVAHARNKRTKELLATMLKEGKGGA